MEPTCTPTESTSSSSATSSSSDSLCSVPSIPFPLLGVDLETTGLNPMKDRITSVGVSSSTGWANKWNVNPEQRLTPEVRALTGLRDEWLARCRVFADVADEVAMTISTAVATGHVVILFNGTFDLGFLLQAFRRLDRISPLTWGHIVDPFRWAKRAWPRAPSLKLQAIAQHYRIPDGGHDALADAECAWRVAEQMFLEGHIPLDPAKAAAGPEKKR